MVLQPGTEVLAFPLRLKQDMHVCTRLPEHL